MYLIKKITGKLKRKISDSAQLIALPKAVMIYTDDGSVIITPRLAKDIQASLPQITKQAEEYEKQEKSSTE